MISELSVISKKAQLGNNVSVGAFTIIHDSVVIGDNVEIEGFCELGLENGLCNETPLTIGSDSHIRSQSILYKSSSIGEGFVTGHRVTIREKATIGNFVQVGTLSDIQGHCEIGDYVKMHSNVHIGQYSRVSNFVWLFPYVVLTNDPHPPSETLMGCEIGEFSVVATMSVVLPGIKIGKDSLIGAGSVVGINVKDEMIFVGNPGKEIGHVSKIKLKDGSRRPAYPWRAHFHRGYPEELVSQWVEDLKAVAE